MSKSFPKRSVVYHGCTLAMIVEAIAVLDKFPFPSRYWYGSTYLYDAGDGNHAAVTFRGEMLVATLFDHESDRNPRHWEPAIDVEQFFRGMPASHRHLAEECLGYWPVKKGGQLMPCVTTAFWDEGERLTAAEPWDQVWKHGAHVIRRELIEDLDTALAEWQVNHQLSPEQIAFAHSLFLKKMARPKEVLELGPSEMEFLRATAAGETGLDSEANWFLRAGAPWMAQAAGRDRHEEVRQGLASIGIQMPP